MPSARRVVRWASLTAVLILASSLLPPVRTRGRAAAAMMEALEVSVPRPFAPEVIPVTAKVGGVGGRLYAPAGPAPPVLIVPGATPEGVEDRRVAAVARGIARSRRTVFVPDLELYRERFSEEDLERIVAAVIGLADRSEPPVPVTVLGFSYGGSFALVAAADPRLEGRLGGVAVLGAYFDLVGVIQAVTTGGSVVGARWIPWEPHPLARDILFARAAELAPEPERDALLDALAGGIDPDRLGPETRPLYELLSNKDPHRTFELAADLRPNARRLLERFSPTTVAGQITVPVAAMHSTDDPLVPYGELERLADGLPGAQISTVSLFRHVDFDPASPKDWIDATPDLLRLWGFTTWVLRERIDERR